MHRIDRIDEGEATTFDCGLGLFFSKTGREIYYGLSPELQASFDKFLDYLNFPYPNMCEFEAPAGCYTYKNDELSIYYQKENCPPPDVKCFLTIKRITIL